MDGPHDPSARRAGPVAEPRGKRPAALRWVALGLYVHVTCPRVALGLRAHEADGTGEGPPRGPPAHPPPCEWAHPLPHCWRPDAVVGVWVPTSVRGRRYPSSTDVQ
eukprot:12511310-Alexandrium_andersonii.AAC.1